MNLRLKWYCLGKALRVPWLLSKVPRCILIAPKLADFKPLFVGAAVSMALSVATLSITVLNAATTLLSPAGSIGYLLRGMNRSYRLDR